MCHRKALLADMQSMSECMRTNRRQGTAEVVSFINRQAEDARDQAKSLIDNAIDRIIKASQNITVYIENRRQTKLHRLSECLDRFDSDADVLKSRLSRRIFLPARTLVELRAKYAYNMFDASSTVPIPRADERFFDSYRYYDELVELRQKWTFLQAALTTIYFPAKKDISLDQILTFVEYRHDRALENYREYLSNNGEFKETAVKSKDVLLHELSFLARKRGLTSEVNNFTHVRQDTPLGSTRQTGETDDYKRRFHRLDASMKALEKHFQTTSLLLTNNNQQI